ncbi:MAG: hypothetical protein QXM86_02940 [Candidatus Bathyarchaeia archaeon]
MIGSKKAETFDACPYCLTEIKVGEDAETVEAKREKIEIKQTEIQRIEEAPSTKIQKMEGCHYYIGYLSQRSTKEKIPEECMVCENIVKCMLKNVTG